MIVGLQVLGQTVLGFRVSLAQILVSVLTCVVIDAGWGWLRSRPAAWPGSALLTGNSVAFILRSSGTRHGDWWSLNGIEYFVAAAVVAMLSKQLIRPGGRHVYNPSNLGLVACLLVAGVDHVYPQYLWWGSVGVPVGLALALIAVGTLWVVRPLGMLPMAVAFMAPFTLFVGTLAGSGQCFVARWSADPVCGRAYWSGICASPELLVFVLFMMSDPRTAPASRGGRIVYGAATAALAAALLRSQATEFGVKVAILASLTVVCTLVGLCRVIAGRVSPGRRRRRRIRALLSPAMVVALAIATVVPVEVASLAHSQRVLDVELGPVVPGGPGGQ